MKSSQHSRLALSIALVVLLQAVTFTPLMFVCTLTGRVSTHCCCPAPQTRLPRVARSALQRPASCCEISSRRAQQATATSSPNVAALVAAQPLYRLAIQRSPARPLLQGRHVARSRAPPPGPPLFIRHCALLV